MKTILFVGSGSLGHVYPAMSVYSACQSSAQCILLTDPSLAPVIRASFPTAIVRTLSSPRFPRTLGEWMLLVPRMMIGIVRALIVLRTLKPSIVFLKGGHLALMIGIAAWINGTPCIAHASDAVLSTTDRILLRLTRAFYTGFPLHRVSVHCHHIGNPTLPCVTQGRREDGMTFTGFSGVKPILLILGGSQGAVMLNTWVTHHLHRLLEMVDVIHVTGKGKYEASTHEGYCVREHLSPEELAHCYAIADVAISRAGAGAMSELVATNIPMILCPLEGVGGNHQRHNAQYFTDHHAAIMIREHEMNTMIDVVTALLETPEKRKEMASSARSLLPLDSTTHLAQILLEEIGATRV